MAWYSPRMLKSPSSRFPARTTLCAPSGRSSISPTACSDIESEEADRVLAHDLPLRLGAEGQAEDVLGVVEVVVWPVGCEQRAVLAVPELEQLDHVDCPLGLFDGLGSEVEAAHVVTRPLLEYRHLAAALDVLLVQAVGDPRDPAGAGLHEGDSKLRKTDRHAGLEHADEVGDHGQRVGERVHGQRRAKALELEGKDG